MKKVTMIAMMVMSFTASAYTTYYSGGGFSQTYRNATGGSTTYNSDGSFSQSW